MTSDEEYINALAPMGGSYMTAVSPWFFTHYSPQTYNKNVSHLLPATDRFSPYMIFSGYTWAMTIYTRRAGIIWSESAAKLILLRSSLGTILGNLITLVPLKVHNQIVRHGWTGLIILVSFSTFSNLCLSAENVVYQAGSIWHHTTLPRSRRGRTQPSQRTRSLCGLVPIQLSPLHPIQSLDLAIIRLWVLFSAVMPTGSELFLDRDRHKTSFGRLFSRLLLRLSRFRRHPLSRRHSKLQLGWQSFQCLLALAVVWKQCCKGTVKQSLTFSPRVSISTPHHLHTTSMPSSLLQLDMCCMHKGIPGGFMDMILYQ